MIKTDSGTGFATNVRCCQIPLTTCFHRISEWKGESLNATECGLKETDGKFIPLRTYLPRAPDHLLDVIRYNCKAGCSTLKYICRGNGLECTFTCGECKGLAALMQWIQRLLRLKLMNEQSQSFKNVFRIPGFYLLLDLSIWCGQDFLCYLVKLALFA